MGAQTVEIVDFHSHILPGLDDGSRDAAMSLAMLREMAGQGITTCVATPHFYGYRRTVREFLSARAASWETLRPCLTPALPRLRLGAEVALFAALPQLPDAALSDLCIEGTRTLLLEMPFAQWTDFEVNALSRLCLERRVQVVLAHLERYLPLQRNRDYLCRVLRMPLWAQVNGESLLSMRRRGEAVRLFARGQAHLLGSDCHNLTDRRPDLLRARRVLEKQLGAAAVERVDGIAARLLRGQEGSA